MNCRCNASAASRRTSSARFRALPEKAKPAVVRYGFAMPADSSAQSESHSEFGANSQSHDFSRRHIGPRTTDLPTMLEVIGVATLDELVDRTVPELIRLRTAMNVPAARNEHEALEVLAGYASLNVEAVSMIGLGYTACHTPNVVLRNVLENPAWYTAYTPYQPEISQGRLEALLNFQTVIESITGLPIAGSSLLDEPTAAAEAMTLASRANSKDSSLFIVDADSHPQTIDVVRTRALPLGIEVKILDVAGITEVELSSAFGLLLSYPGSTGQIRDIEPLLASAREQSVITAVACDLLALTLLTPPGEMGADIVVGSAQRFGVPMGFGGPHAGFMSVRQGLERMMPGRLVGVSVDSTGRPAMRLALQTREQHIRREKATSNICTAQVLLAVIAGMYAAWHGPTGLRQIAKRAHQRALEIANAGSSAGLKVIHKSLFDTVLLECRGQAHKIQAAALERGINIRLVDADHVSVTTDETTTQAHVVALADAFRSVAGTTTAGGDTPAGIPSNLLRTSDFLTHPVFNSHHSETQMLRYLRKLSDKDIALDRSMIPLGSCTMKLNATAEMIPITWSGFANIHPFAPADQTTGYGRLISELQTWLAEITGYDAVSVQPNAGSQGEFAGLLAIAGWHASRGEAHRDICLIPSSAHGTNAASAVMAGMRVVVVACDENGNVDLDDVRAKIAEHGTALAALMITYPSTHGVFEEQVGELCALVHEAGGQVYVDGANLNALVGLAQPGKFGADVSHLNLHKTFCIPHGGGGPGVGPIGVRAHLIGFLPSHPLRPDAGPREHGVDSDGVGPISGSAWGSAGILPIPWMYIAMMGADGLTAATTQAIVSANYIASRLRTHYPVLYTGANGFVAHECILDLRPITKDTGVTVDDVAKRLMDYGFHAPTMSFPVAGTLMVEPTESESLEELDRFCDAMIAIRAEIDAVADGAWSVEDSPLRHAPHTAEVLVGEWNRPYERRVGAFPPGVDPASKYWPPVGRIDGAYGDRNLVCSCPSPAELSIR